MSSALKMLTKLSEIQKFYTLLNGLKITNLHENGYLIVVPLKQRPICDHQKKNVLHARACACVFDQGILFFKNYTGLS